MADRLTTEGVRDMLSTRWAAHGRPSRLAAVAQDLALDLLDARADRDQARETQREMHRRAQDAEAHALRALHATETEARWMLGAYREAQAEAERLGLEADWTPVLDADWWTYTSERNRARLAVLTEERDRLRAEVERLRHRTVRAEAEVRRYEEDCAVCPEDQTVTETVTALRAELDGVRAALGSGADEDAWPPGLTVPKAVARLRGSRDALRAEVDRIHRTGLRDIRSAWRFGYLAALDDAAHEGASHDQADGCDDPQDYMDEADDAALDDEGVSDE